MYHEGIVNERERPRVVISILTWNKKALLENCIASILEHTRYSDYRICVYDQASDDGTREYLEFLGDKVDVIYSPENTGFVRGNNEVMRKYRDSDIVLLNNDTLVTHGWLQALIECAYNDEKIGIVGAKLVFPDGKLQESGGEIYSDGSGRNIGRNDNPDRKEYNTIREVDYCSGACLYIKRAFLNIVGGFDERFSPAYYEDTDLCFSARHHGFKVMYQPRCRVIHIEGATSGVDITSGFKKYQALNQPKFAEKWAEVLQRHRKSFWEAPKGDGKDQVLVVATAPPLHDRASGELRLYQIVKILSRHYHVVFLACNARESVDMGRYVEDLRKLGVTVYANDLRMFPDLRFEIGPLSPVNLELLLAHNSFRAAFLEFYHVADHYIDLIRKYSPETVVITDSVDVHFIRELREALIKQDAVRLLDARKNKMRELSVYERSDVVVAVTEEDKGALLKESPELDVRVLPNLHDLSSEDISRGNREGLLYVGCFDFPPNVDAVVYFCRDILPLVKKEIHDMKVTLVGYAPPPEVLELQNDNVTVTGFVPETKPYLDSALISIAPLRYGAGMKGKIGEALAHGVPIVTTSIGAEGMGVRHGEHLLIADTPKDFADAIIKLYRDKGLRERLSRNGRDFIRDTYSVQAAERGILSMLGTLPEAEDRKARRFDIGKHDSHQENDVVITDKVTVIITSTISMQHVKNCIDNLTRCSDNLHEIIVLDKKMGEDLAGWLDRRFIKYVHNKNGGESGIDYLKYIMSCSTEFVAFLHGDAVVTPHWDTRLIHHIRGGKSIGAVAAACPCHKKYGTFYELEDIAWNTYQNNKGKYKETNDISNYPCLLISRRALYHAGEQGSSKYGLPSMMQCVTKSGYRLAIARDVVVHHEEEYSRPPTMKKPASKKRCTVIIHGYKNKESLFATVDSIVTQGISKKVVEVIIIENGSDYGMKKDLRSDYPFTIKTVATGSGQVRRALEAADGEYIIFIRNDTIASRGLVEAHLDAHVQMSPEKVIVMGYIGRGSSSPGPLFREYLTSVRKNKGKVTLSFDPYNSSSISANKELFQDVELNDEFSFGWQMREFIYRSQMDGIKTVYNSDADVYPYTEPELKSHVPEQKRAGRESVLLALRHPNRLCGITSLKEKCKMDFSGKEDLVGALMEMAAELEQMPSASREGIMAGDQRFTDIIYTTILNYYYAMGISEALTEYEGRNWLEEFLESAHEDQMNVTEKIHAENQMYEHLLRGIKAEQQGDVNTALYYTEKARQAQPEAPQPYFYTGNYHVRQGRLDLAEKSYETCIRNHARYQGYTRELVPVTDYVSNNLYLALLGAHQGKYVRTIELLKWLLDNNYILKSSQELFCNLYLAKCYEKKGLLSEAVEHYGKVIDIEPGNAEAASNLAMLHIKINDRTGARGVLKKFMDNHGENISLLKARDGHLTVQVRKNGRTFALHSRYMPLKEAEDILSTYGLSKDSIIVQLGLGLGYPVLAIRNCISKSTPVLAVERDEALFNLALLNNLWDDLTSQDHTTFLAGRQDHSEVLERLEALTEKFPYKEIVVIKHSPSFQMYPDYYNGLYSHIIEFTEAATRKNAEVQN